MSLFIQHCFEFQSITMILNLSQWYCATYMKPTTNMHCAKKPVTTILNYPWKCTVLHCNHLGNTWKPLVLMTRHFDYCPSRLAWWLLAFLCYDESLQSGISHFTSANSYHYQISLPLFPQHLLCISLVYQFIWGEDNFFFFLYDSCQLQVFVYAVYGASLVWKMMRRR